MVSESRPQKRVEEPSGVTAAVQELASLHELSLSVTVPPEALADRLDRRVVFAMWRRADEAVKSLLDLHPSDRAFQPPKIMVSLASRWLLDGATLVKWIGDDPTPPSRVQTYIEHGEAERDKFLRRLYPEESPPARPRSAMNTEPVRNMKERTESIGMPDLYTAYSGQCEATHWNARWLREMVRESDPSAVELSIWERDLHATAGQYRVFILTSAYVCGIDLLKQVASISISAEKALGPSVPPK